MVVLQEEQQEQRLLQRTEEHQTAVNRVEEVREEEHRLRSRVKVITEEEGVIIFSAGSEQSAVDSN